VPQAERRSPGSFNFAVAIGDAAPRPLSQPRARIAIDPGRVERGLLKLVLSVVELIRQLMEKQAMRRIDAGTLTSDEVERLGVTLMEVEATIRGLQRQFGIDELNIDLGPIGPLLDEQES
jgi:hypothetical protein